MDEKATLVVSAVQGLAPLCRRHCTPYPAPPCANPFPSPIPVYSP